PNNGTYAKSVIMIWKIAYKLFKESLNYSPPISLEKLFTPSITTNMEAIQTLTWIHICTIYEIWCWKYSEKWGNGAPALKKIIVSRLSSEFQVPQKRLTTKNSKINILTKYSRDEFPLSCDPTIYNGDELPRLKIKKKK
ncbi:26173_t:CDS:1, partial [Racocetra persica]